MSKLNTFLLTVVLILQASTLWLLREMSKDVSSIEAALAALNY